MSRAESRGVGGAYYPALDGLRGVAVLLVLLFHAETGWPGVNFGGKVGVDVFFVLSGFLITSILLREYERSGGLRLRRFYTRRLIRLLPALLVAVAVLLLPGVLIAESWAEWLAASASALFYLTPVTVGLLDWRGWEHTWTLGLEEYFYLIFPVLLLIGLCRPTRLGGLSGLAAIISVSSLVLLAINATARFIDPDPYGLFDYLRVGGIGLGCALALILRNIDSSRYGGLAALSGVVLVAGGIGIAGPNPFDGFSFILTDVGSCAIIYAVTRGAPSHLMTALSLRPLVFLGLISYELYLWHAPVQTLLVWGMNVTSTVAAVIGYPIAFLLAVLTQRALQPVQRSLRARVDRAPGEGPRTRSARRL